MTVVSVIIGALWTIQKGFNKRGIENPNQSIIIGVTKKTTSENR